MFFFLIFVYLVNPIVFYTSFFISVFDKVVGKGREVKVPFYLTFKTKNMEVLNLACELVFAKLV